MKKNAAACLAMAAFVFSPAHGQAGSTNKQCYKGCVDILTAEKIKKTVYDYDAVESDTTKTDAEKKKSHKKAVAGVCTTMCENQ